MVGDGHCAFGSAPEDVFKDRSFHFLNRDAFGLGRFVWSLGRLPRWIVRMGMRVLKTERSTIFRIVMVFRPAVQAAAAECHTLCTQGSVLNGPSATPLHLDSLWSR